MKVFYFTLFLAAALSANAQNGFDSQSGNVLDALSGRLAGVNVINYSGDPTSKGPAVYINGLRSLNGGYPLIVVDGIIYEGDVSSINPNDVEYVTVSTDPLLLVKYGSRAQDGVLEITTKKGDLKYLSYNKSGLGGKKELLNFRAKWGVNSNAIGQYDLLTTEEVNASKYYNPIYTYKFIDFYDDMYRMGLRQEYNVDYSKTFDKGNVFASVGYLDNNGILKGNCNQRITARVNAEYRPKDGLKFGVKSSLAYRDADKSYMSEDLLKILANSEVICYSDKEISSPANYLIYKGNETETSTAFSFNTYGKMRLCDDLYLDADFSYLSNSPFVKRGMNKDCEPSGLGLIPSDSLRGSYHSYSFSPEIKLRWQKLWKKSRLNLEAGVKYYTYNIKDWNCYRRCASYDAVAINNNNDKGMRDSYSSLLASANYYFLNGISVKAGLNRQSYGTDELLTGEKWLNNWAVGASFDVLDVFHVASPVFNIIRFDASYGVIVKDEFDASMFDLTRTTPARYILNDNTNGNYTNMSSYYEEYVKLNNRFFNAGIYVDAFNGKLRGSVEFFHNKTNGLRCSESDMNVLGIVNEPHIDGVVSNTGVNLWLSTDMRISDFDWTADLRLSHYRNKISRLRDRAYGFNVISVNFLDSRYSCLSDGDDLSAIRLPKYAGKEENGYKLWYADEQMTTKTDDVNEAYLFNRGSNTPFLYGGLTNTVAYHGFDFSLSLGFQFGGKVYDSTYGELLIQRNGNYGEHRDILSMQSLDWDERFYVKNDKCVTDASYLSVNKMTFGYKFPKKLLVSSPFASLRIYADADNLALFSARKGMDPRCLSFTGASTYTGYYPMMRTVSVGVEAAF